MVLHFHKVHGTEYTWKIENDSGEFLGCIARERVGGFIHFTFRPMPDTYFTNGCLKEIRDFITKCYGIYKERNLDKERKK